MVDPRGSAQFDVGDSRQLLSSSRHHVQRILTLRHPEIQGFIMLYHHGATPCYKLV